VSVTLFSSFSLLTINGGIVAAVFTLAPGATALRTLDVEGYRALVGCVFPGGIPGMEAADRTKGFLPTTQPGAMPPSVHRLATASYVSVSDEREWTWWAHTGGGNVLAFKQPSCYFWVWAVVALTRTSRRR
jgi:hypothetical protein